MRFGDRKGIEPVKSIVLPLRLTTINSENGHKMHQIYWMRVKLCGRYNTIFFCIKLNPNFQQFDVLGNLEDNGEVFNLSMLV